MSVPFKEIKKITPWSVVAPHGAGTGVRGTSELIIHQSPPSEHRRGLFVNLLSGSELAGTCVNLRGPFKAQGELINVEQAWQAALGQIRLEMPKSCFDRYVRDTRVLSYADGLFRIATSNAFGRERLEERFGNVVRNKLKGIMNRWVTVHFVLQEAQTAPQTRPGKGEIARLEDYAEEQQKRAGKAWA